VHRRRFGNYDRRAWIPAGTSGNTRRYSDRDIEMLRQIQDLTQDRGINLAGVKYVIIEMQAELERSAAGPRNSRPSRVADRKGGDDRALRSVFLRRAGGRHE